MKKSFLALIALTLIFAALLCACGTQSHPGETSNNTEANMNIYQKADPKQDDTLNVLMIGNSGCYYYVEELYGMLEAAGIRANVCNVYYSGCKLEQHWTWWKNGDANYEFYTTNENGRQKQEGLSLDHCLQQQNWDIITLQESSSAIRKHGAEQTFEKAYLYIEDIIGYVREQFPMSACYWHQTWAYQVGHDRNGYVISGAEEQAVQAQGIQDFALEVCQRSGLKRINSGDAWQIVRKDYGYDNMCARIGKGENNEGDYYHDGDWGGGQYLNASVWFEVITGQSIIGNTYRPHYNAGGIELSLTEDQIKMFQEAAHKAVEQMKENGI